MYDISRLRVKLFIRANDIDVSKQSAATQPNNTAHRNVSGTAAQTSNLAPHFIFTIKRKPRSNK